MFCSSALEFCNVNAIPLTKQLEDQHNVMIKRVSDKNRNPDNVANVAELKINMDDIVNIEIPDFVED